jgi:hypothetical protein
MRSPTRRTPILNCHWSGYSTNAIHRKGCNQQTSLDAIDAVAPEVGNISASSSFCTTHIFFQCEAPSLNFELNHPVKFTLPLVQETRSHKLYPLCCGLNIEIRESDCRSQNPHECFQFTTHIDHVIRLLDNEVLESYKYGAIAQFTLSFCEHAQSTQQMHILLSCAAHVMPVPQHR